MDVKFAVSITYGIRGTPYLIVGQADAIFLDYPDGANSKGGGAGNAAPRDPAGQPASADIFLGPSGP
jgi:hypothetical protein